MKKRLYQILMIVMFVGLLLTVSVSSEAASDKTNGKNMEKALKYYKKGKMKKARKYNKKLDAVAKETCVKKMSKKMKKAYRKAVKKYSTKTNAGEYIWGYYLTDIDNDKKADLIVKYGSCEADVRMDIYQYKKGKAVKVSTIGAGHTSLCAYPNHKGIVLYWGHMGYESISVMKLKNGKVSSTDYGSREVDYDANPWFSPRCVLDDHTSYSYGEVKLDFKDLK